MFQELGAQCREEFKSKDVSLICISFGKYGFFINTIPQIANIFKVLANGKDHHVKVLPLNFEQVNLL